MTGVMDSIERDDAQKLIESYGGRVTKALSGKSSYLVVGSDPGESKIQKVPVLLNHVLIFLFIPIARQQN